MKIQKKNGWGSGGVRCGWGVGSRLGVGLGGQGESERMIEVFVKIQKKNWGGGGRGVRWGRVGGGWVRVDVNAMLGVGGDVGYGGVKQQ